MKDSPYKCHFCSKRFQYESRFLKHKCKQALRAENLQTPLGQAAWRFYQDWMKLQHKRVQDEKTFLKSKYYESFNRFSKHVKELQLPNPQSFIKLMITNDFPPTMWTLNETYVMYLEHLDRAAPAQEHAQITADTIFRLSDRLNCDMSEIFLYLTASELIELIRERKMSPWILLNSTKFMEFFRDNTNPEQKIVLEALIRPKYWTTQFSKKLNTVNYMKDIVAEMNL